MEYQACLVSQGKWAYQVRVDSLAIVGLTDKAGIQELLATLVSLEAAGTEVTQVIQAIRAIQESLVSRGIQEKMD
jgi:hypothetical protein